MDPLSKDSFQGHVFEEGPLRKDEGPALKNEFRFNGTADMS